MEIVLCTGCNNHGNCSNEIREDIRASEYFKYAKCICEPEFDGQFRFTSYVLDIAVCLCI